MSHEWYVVAEDRELGPLTSKQLRELAASGELLPDALVRREDMDQPRRAASIKGLIPDVATEPSPHRPQRARTTPSPTAGSAPTSRRARTGGRPLGTPRGVYTDPTGIGLASMFMLGVCAATDVAAVVAGFGQRSLLAMIARGEDVSSAQIDASDSFYASTGIAQIGSFVITGILFLAWLKRTSRNQAALGTRAKYSPGWAVGAWFVPFLNLYRPMQIVQEIYSNSARTAAGGLRTASSSPIVSVWWGGWILCNALSRVGGRMQSAAEGPELLSKLSTGTNILIVADVVSLVTAVLAILVVRQITSLQTTAAQTTDADL